MARFVVARTVGRSCSDSAGVMGIFKANRTTRSVNLEHFGAPCLLPLASATKISTDISQRAAHASTPVSRHSDHTVQVSCTRSVIKSRAREVCRPCKSVSPVGHMASLGDLRPVANHPKEWPDLSSHGRWTGLAPILLVLRVLRARTASSPCAKTRLEESTAH